MSGPLPRAEGPGVLACCAGARGTRLAAREGPEPRRRRRSQPLLQEPADLLGLLAQRVDGGLDVAVVDPARRLVVQEQVVGQPVDPGDLAVGLASQRRVATPAVVA